jgi:hypothetical protein
MHHDHCKIIDLLMVTTLNFDGEDQPHAAAITGKSYRLKGRGGRDEPGKRYTKPRTSGWV